MSQEQNTQDLVNKVKAFTKQTARTQRPQQQPKKVQPKQPTKKPQSTFNKTQVVKKKSGFGKTKVFGFKKKVGGFTKLAKKPSVVKTTVQRNQQQPPTQISTLSNKDRLIRAQEFNKQQIQKQEQRGGLSVAQIANRSTNTKKQSVINSRIEAEKRKQEVINKFDFGTNVDNPSQRSDDITGFPLPTLSGQKTQKGSRGRFGNNKNQIISIGNQVDSFVDHFPQSKVAKGIGKVQKGVGQVGEGVSDIGKVVAKNHPFAVLGSQVSKSQPVQDFGNFFDQGLTIQKDRINKVVTNPTPQNVGNVLVGEPVTNFLQDFFGGGKKITKTVTRSSSTKKPVAKKTAKVPKFLKKKKGRDKR